MDDGPEPAPAPAERVLIAKYEGGGYCRHYGTAGADIKFVRRCNRPPWLLPGMTIELKYEDGEFFPVREVKGA